MLVIAAIVFLVSAALSLIATPAARRLAERLGVMDRPGARKVHEWAVAKLGGLAVAVSAAAGIAAALVLAPRAFEGRILGFDGLGPTFVGALLVFAVGLWDDVRGVSPGAKISVEVLAAVVIIASGITIERVTLGGATYSLGVMAAPVTLLWILVITNAFNLVDGLDGLAAGLTAIAAATCAAILAARGHLPQAFVLMALLGAVAGFLPYNFYPASIFLGDAGSLLIGFLLAVTAITGWQKGATVLALGVPMLMFALPIAEVFTSIVRRLGRPSTPRPSLRQMFQADQEHIHHRLMARGFSHRATVLILCLVSLALSGLALFTIQAP